MEKLTATEIFSRLKTLYLVFSRKYATIFLLGVVVAVVFNQYYSFAVNLSYSLPHKLYIIDKTYNSLNRLKKGDYVAFAWQGEFYPVGTRMIKEIAGMPGDEVTQNNRSFSINGQPVGYAKEKSLTGMPLEANQFSGRIPNKFIWVMGTHKDSLDSRYQITGLIHAGQIIGRAYPIF